MDAHEIRNMLAQIDWNAQFDQPTLKRANVYLREGHLQSLRLEPGPEGRACLHARVRGSGEAIYSPRIEFRHDARKGLSVLSSCDCPVQGLCKHQALVLLYAQVYPPEQWPQAQTPAPAPSAAFASAPEQLDALPEWLRAAMHEHGGPATTSTLPAWERWFDLVERSTEASAPGSAPDVRRFGLILREQEGFLAVQPAWLRPGRGRTGGWVDPQALQLSWRGVEPAPPEGWSDEDAIALSLLLTAGLEHRQNAAVMIDNASLEAALVQLLPRHPVYWKRGNTPLEVGPDLSLQLVWEEHPDGSQNLIAQAADTEVSTLVLRGYGAWYVQPQALRVGRINGDPRLLELVDSAPSLLPENVPQLASRLATLDNLAIAAPRQRTLRSLRTGPIPVLVMTIARIEPPSRNSNRAVQRVGVAGLHFEYDDHRLLPYSGDNRVRRLQGEDVLEIERDLAREQRAEARLATLGLVEASNWNPGFSTRAQPFRAHHYLLCPSPYRSPSSPEAWTQVLGELSTAGFRIEYAADFPRDDVVEIEAWHADLDEVDNAWFDVSLGIDVEGERIDLLPILRRLLVDPEFSLRQPEDEAEDATWRVRIDDNRSVRLPMARLRAMLEPLLEWLLTSNEGLRLHQTQAETLQRIETETEIPWRGGERLRARIQTLRDARTLVPVPDGFHGQLRPYQHDGLAWLNFLADAGLGGILADDMGLGKTVQVLAHLVLEKERGRLQQPALVVAPTSLVGNWRDEAARFAPDLRVLVLHGADRAARYEAIPEADLVITTYPLLPRDHEDLCQQQFSLLVLDEAQAIKNARSQAAQVVREIPAQRRLAMTGTPLENHLGELWAQFDAVEPGLLGSRSSFNHTYRTPIEKHGDRDRQERLNRRIGALLLRRRKEDVLDDLPPKTEIIHSLELAGGQRQLYETLRLTQHERVRESIAQRGLGQSGIVVLDALLKLRQACCDPRLVKLEAARKVKESVKLDALLDLLANLRTEGRRVLVFSQFTTMLGLIGDALTQRRIQYISLTGDTPSAARTARVQSFQEGKVPVFLISLKAGGVGLNLTAADAVIHYDPWWNPAVEAQATDRAHRIGQDKPVFVYKLICAGTVEEKIQAMQHRKAELAQAVLEGGSTSALRFDEDDLAELFGPG